MCTVICPVLYRHYADRLNSDLADAVIEGNAGAVSRLLRRGADPNTTVDVLPDPRRHPLEALQAMLGYGQWGLHDTVLIASLDILPGKRHTVRLIPPENVAITEALLAYGADVNARNQRHDTALLLAAQYGYDKTISMLLSHGARVNVADYTGMTPLMWALGACRYDTVRALLIRGADVNAADHWGITVLQIAVDCATTSGIDDRIIPLLLKYGADARQRNPLGTSAIDIARKRNAHDLLRLLTGAPERPHGR
jgi:ankyrin repeat protein